MSFELDQDYFNRAGDKVRYVGHLGYFKSFRDTEGNIYSVNSDGTTGGTGIVATNDILGKWEITDDPDRVYIHKEKEYRFRRFMKLIPGKENLIVAGLVASDQDFAIVSISSIEKILIKPRQLGTGIASKDLAWLQHEDEKKYNKEYQEAYTKFVKDKDRNVCPYCLESFLPTFIHICVEKKKRELKKIIDSMAHLKKIEPLEYHISDELTDKINELIHIHNARIG